MLMRSPSIMLKFIFFSVLGILYFFVPIFGVTPMILLVGWLKSLLTAIKDYLTFVICLALVMTFLLSRFTNSRAMKKYHKSDGWVKGIFYMLAALCAFLVAFDIGPQWLLSANVGGLAVDLAGTALITVSACSLMVVVMLNSGVVEFFGALIEPIMRPLFRLPGRAAVDCLASFVSAAAVGVFFTDRAYQMKVYTEREAYTVMTCWSVCSLGFFAIIVSIAGIEHIYGLTVITSLTLCFILSAICVRIWPWIKRPTNYIDGTEQTKKMCIEMQRPANGRFNKAVSDGLTRASEFSVETFVLGAKDALAFTQKIVAYVAAIAVLALVLAEYTPVFTWLGYPMIPLLRLCGFTAAEAAVMAPATLIGISEVALPAILVAGSGISEKAVFFICVLSTVQIIFFSESVNAMLESKVKMNIANLCLIFLIRTLIALPLLAIACMLLF